MLVCFFEEIIGEPEALLKKCFQHLGVREDLFDWNTNLKEPFRCGTKAVIPPNLRSVLEEIYQPKVECLQDYLGVNLSPWILQSK